VPPYDGGNFLDCNKAFPPLPPIPQGHLSEAPFTHPGTVDAKYNATNTLTYDRLEFLGDAYIEIIATRQIYSRCPHLLTGRQSQLRESMVRNSTLAKFSRQYEFHKRIKVQEQEVDGKQWEKVLADIFEAYVAAVVLSNPETGFEIAEDWLTELWTEILMQHNAKTSGVDYKTLLASKIAYSNYGRITYQDHPPMKPLNGVQRNGISIYFTGWGYDVCLGSAVGCGKKEAGQLAAKLVLEGGADVIEQISDKKREHVAAHKAEMEEKERQQEEANASTCAGRAGNTA